MALGQTYLGQAYLGQGYEWISTTTYTVTFNANGGVGAMSPQTSTIPMMLTLNTLTRAEYAFVGWNTVAGGGGTSYVNGGTYNTPANVTLYAQWTALGVSHESDWIYATPTGTLQADEITQFLSLHGVTVVAQGSPVVVVTGALTTWQTLGEVDQPFVAPANVGWFRIPLTSTDLAPDPSSGWPNAAPVTVSIYTDSSGVPGSLVASTVVPAEQIETVQEATWPEPDDLLFGPAVTDTQSSLPQLPGSGWTGITSLVARSWAMTFATQSPNDSQMWVAPFDGSDLGGWTAGTTLPVSGIDQVIYAPNSQVVVILSGGLMWSATFSQTGVVGSWQALPTLAGLGGGLIGILTYQGLDYLVAVETSGNTSYAQIMASASITAWTMGVSFPVPFSAGVSYQVGSKLVMIVQDGTVSTVVELSTISGGWLVSGTLSAAANQVLGIIGQSIITTDGTDIDATSLTELGIAPWSLPVPFSVSGATVTMLSFSTGTGYVVFWIPTTSAATGWQQSVYIPSWASVPLPQSLTPGSTYHLVLSASNTLVVGTAVPVVSVSSGPSGLLYNGSAWVALGGGIPILAFYAAFGAPLALIGTGKTSILWFDTPSGDMTSVVELVGNTSNSRAMTYSDGVLAEVV